MKCLALLCCLAVCSLQLNAQIPAWNWARGSQLSGNGSGQVMNVATDRSLNSIIVGTFSNNITFGSDVLTETNGATVFIAKYSQSGVVQWGRCASGNSSFGYAVAADAAGNVYAGGYFFSTIQFGSYTLTSVGSNDIFLVKYDANGNVLWATSAGGTSGDQLRSLATDETGVYLTGWFNSPTLAFDSYTLTNSGTINSYLAKYSSSGTAVWATQSRGTNSQGKIVTVDAYNNVYTSGTFALGNYIFGNDTLSNHGTTDSYLVKYSAGGTEIWARSIGAAKQEYISGITINNAGTLFITGYFSSSSIVIGSTTLVNNGNFNSFVASYTSGGSPVWATVSSSPNTITSGSIATGDCIGCSGNSAACDNLYVSGTLNTTSTMYFGTVGFTPQAGADNSWFAVFSSSGAPLDGMVLPYGGADENALVIDINRHLYLAGDYGCASGATLGSDTLSCAGTSNNPFISQLQVNGCLTTLPVTLTSFTAEMKNDACRLYWTVSSEINNDYFTVERSKDGKEFSPLLTVGSKARNGNSTVPLSYNTTDDKPLAGVSYYRLKQTDFDGKYNYSEMAAVKNSSDTHFSIYPNPAHNSFTVSFDGPKTGSQRLEIYDVVGTEVYSETMPNPQSKIRNSFSAGVYFLKISDGENVYTQKLVIE